MHMFRQGFKYLSVRAVEAVLIPEVTCVRKKSTTASIKTQNSTKSRWSGKWYLLAIL